MSYYYNNEQITGSITIGQTAYPYNWDFSTVPGVEWRDDPPPSLPTTDEIVQQYVAAIDAMIRERCQEKRYDTPDSFARYVTSEPDPASATYDIEMRYKQESIAGTNWVSAVYAKAEMVMGAVITGQMAMPTQSELLSMLPVLNW